MGTRFVASAHEEVYQDRLASAMEASGWSVERRPRCWVPGLTRGGFSVGKPDLWAQLRRGERCSSDVKRLLRQGIHTIAFEVKKTEKTNDLTCALFQVAGYMSGWNFSADGDRPLKRPDTCLFVSPEFLEDPSVSSRDAAQILDRVGTAERILWKRGCTVLRALRGWAGFSVNVGTNAPMFIRLFPLDQAIFI